MMLLRMYLDVMFYGRHPIYDLFKKGSPLYAIKAVVFKEQNTTKISTYYIHDSIPFTL